MLQMLSVLRLAICLPMLAVALVLGAAHDAAAQGQGPNSPEPVGDVDVRGDEADTSSGGLATLEETPSDEDDLGRNLELTMYTLGGRQFWTDIAAFREYRIQQNVFTGHYRLLDGKNRRQASGSLESCRKKLVELRETQELAPMSGPAVVLIHGIARSTQSFSRMAETLREQGYSVFRFDYPSTQVDIPTTADSLQQFLSSLEGITEIHFVVHSMGGLVVRAWCQRHADPRVSRLVMLGTPNHGAELADTLKSNPVYRLVMGPAGQQLVTDGLIATLPVPQFEFAVIAGGRGNDRGWNPLIPGDDDGTVAVERARLEGAKAFAVVPALHAFLTSDRTAIDYTLRFLKTGSLDQPAAGS